LSEQEQIAAKGADLGDNVTDTYDNDAYGNLINPEIGGATIYFEGLVAPLLRWLHAANCESSNSRDTASPDTVGKSARADSLSSVLKPPDLRHTRHVNWTHGISGRLWQGRYFSCPLDEEHV
jgi:hypothetical protein